MEKQLIRQKILKKLKKQKKEESRKRSLKIKKILFSQPQFLQADRIMFYISKESEVDTTSMIKDALRMGKKVIVPVTLVEKRKIIPSQVKDYKQELEIGRYGIYQPKRSFFRKVLLKDIDLVIVPGVAFDRTGNRLGRGGGYFDRFLAKIKKRNIPMFGLAFKCQVLKQLPVFAHDIPVTKLIYA